MAIEKYMIVAPVNASHKTHPYRYIWSAARDIKYVDETMMVVNRMPDIRS